MTKETLTLQRNFSLAEGWKEELARDVKYKEATQKRAKEKGGRSELHRVQVKRPTQQLTLNF